MSLVATDVYLADLVSDLSEAFRMYSKEAVNLSSLLARAAAPVSPESSGALQKQCLAEVQRRASFQVSSGGRL